MKPLAQMTWKEAYKGFSSLYRKFKLSAQETICAFAQLQEAWLQEHSK